MTIFNPVGEMTAFAVDNQLLYVTGGIVFLPVSTGNLYKEWKMM